MSDTTLNHYKIFCNTDNKYEYIWSEEEPTICPVNNSHSVDLNSISIVHEVGTNIVTIKEENIPTGGNYMCECFQILAATGPNVNTSEDYTWPFPINVLEIKIAPREENAGDDVSLCVAPQTIVGAITAPASSSATEIYVTQTVIDNMMVGYHCHLFDGVNQDDCGRIVSIDKINNKITVETPTVNSFSPLSPTYVQMTVHVINSYVFGPPQVYAVGDGKIGGSYVPANTTVRVTYRNKTAQPKTLSAQLDYLY